MKIDYNKNTNELFEIGNITSGVTIDGTVNVDAIGDMVEMYNADYSAHRIKSNLEGDDRLAGDEVDHLMQAIDVLEEMEEKHEDVIVMGDAPWIEPVETLPMSGGFSLTLEGVQNSIGQGGSIIEESTKENMDTVKKVGENIADTVLGKKPRKKREKREEKFPSASGIITGNKPLSPTDYIKILQEKIELTKLVDDIETIPAIPENISKKGREILLSLDKELSEVIDNYLAMIQTL